jgi:hypothetical protein
MNQATWAVGKAALAAYSDFNSIIEEAVYSAAIRTKVLQDLEDLELLKKNQQDALDSIRQERERLRERNTRFKDEGSLIIDMMRSIKARYMEADAAGRAAILDVVLDKVVLRPNDYYVTFREPFGMLFGLHRVIKESEKGE